MKRLRWAMIVLVCSLALLGAAPGLAGGALSCEPNDLTLRAYSGGALSATLRCAASQKVEGIQITATDLDDVTGDGLLRASLPGSSITFSPGAEIAALEAGRIQSVTVNAGAPPQAGRYLGRLLITWRAPEAGKIEVPLTVDVRTRPALSVEDSKQMTMQLEVGGAPVERRVLLRETNAYGTALAGLRVLPSDLVSTELRVFPAAQVTAGALPQPILAGRLVEVPVTVDPRGVAAGAYKGTLRFETETGSLASVEMTVNVKDGVLWPLITLAAGVFFSIGLSAYQGRGRVRDELVLRVDGIRRTLKANKDLDEAFGGAVEPLMAQAEASLAAANWDAAKTALDTVDGYIVKWNGSGLWRELHLRLEKGAEKIKTLHTPYHQAVLEQIEGLRRRAATLSLEEYQKQARELLESLAEYENISRRCGDLAELRKKAVTLVNQIADPSQKQAWEKKLEEWRAAENALLERRDKLPPTRAGESAAAWEGLKTDIKALAGKMALDIPNIPRGGQDRTDRGDDSAALAQRAAADIAPGLVDLPPLTEISGGRSFWAWLRLAAYSLVVYGVGGVVLVWLGLNNLYATEPTFGANWIRDYLTLLAWGLGGQATINTLADAIRGWGVPFGKSSAAPAEAKPAAGAGKPDAAAAPKPDAAKPK